VNQINLTFFQGMMTFTWYDHIDRWFEAYGFEPEVIYALFQEASNNKSFPAPDMHPESLKIGLLPV